ncbi:MAG: DUF4198 domain-containing protein [Bacteroidota bacterium]
MKKLGFILFALLVFSSHDMFLKQDTYFFSPNTDASIQLFNGTFDRSDNVITRDRMIDVSLVGNGKRTQVDTSQWTEEGKTTILNFKTGAAGTWVAGVSTRARNIEMDAEAFNGYLEHDGVLDMIEWRTANDAMDEDAVEKYSKHVKTVFQVGDQRTDDWKTVLGYPIEFVPVSNPYELKTGDDFQVQLLWQGQPLANQLVYVGSDGAGHTHEHGHEHAEGDDHHHHDAKPLRTNENGIVTMAITDAGSWYLRTIHLVLSEEEGLTHESNWATLTFEVKEQSMAEEEVVTADEEAGGLPTYAYFIGGLALLLGAVFVFMNNRK